MTDTRTATVPTWLVATLAGGRDWEVRGERRYRCRWRDPLTHEHTDVLLVVTSPVGRRYTARILDAEQLHYAVFDLEARTFGKLEAAMAHELLPTCVAPDCDKKAPVVFVAAEAGRLADRDWQAGDEIRLCPGHGNDVVRAQGAYGLDQLAAWLRPDAQLEPLDAFDAEVSYDRADWVDGRRRMLAMAPRGAGFSGTSATAGRATGGPAGG